MENGKSTENLTPRSGTHSNTLLIGAVVISFVLSLVAIIIALVTLSSSTGQTTVQVATPYIGSSSGGLTESEDAEKIWLLSFEHTGFNYGYIDEATGELRGFSIDMATAVCQIANKNCEMVYDTPQRCWESQPGLKSQGGVGLMDGYYDACVGWIHTFDRPRTFRFSDPYTTFESTPAAVLFALKNSSFDWTDLTGKTIGFLDGLAFDEHCLARDTRITGRDLSAEQIRHYSELNHMVEGVKNGEVDAMFFGKRFKNDEMDIISDDIKICFKAGFSLMTRKDNRLIEWWNPAFAKLKATFRWKTICNDLTDEHGHVGGPDGTVCV